VLNQPRYKGAEILLTRDNFGCGSSREHAPWALEDFGFRVLIGPSFADIFFNNCFKNGLLPIKLAADEVDALFAQCHGSEGYRLAVDLQARTITRPDGKVLAFDVDPFRRECLLNGWDDIGLTLRHADKIRDFEARRRIAHPGCLPDSLAAPRRRQPTIKTENHMKICVLPGDGIGPEIIDQTLRVLEAMRGDGVNFEAEALVGGAAVDATGKPLPEATSKLADEADALLLGAVGGPKWDSYPRDQRPELGLLGIRKQLQLFANLRPAILYPSWPMPRR
jgi:3-isopropylmalate dehydratase small subunit